MVPSSIFFNRHLLDAIHQPWFSKSQVSICRSGIWAKPWYWELGCGTLVTHALKLVWPVLRAFHFGVAVSSGLSCESDSERLVPPGPCRLAAWWHSSIQFRKSVCFFRIWSLAPAELHRNWGDMMLTGCSGSLNTLHDVASLYLNIQLSSWLSAQSMQMHPNPYFCLCPSNRQHFPLHISNDIGLCWKFAAHAVLPILILCGQVPVQRFQRSSSQRSSSLKLSAAACDPFLVVGILAKLYLGMQEWFSNASFDHQNGSFNIKT